jgi:hypothetical protein
MTDPDGFIGGGTWVTGDPEIPCPRRHPGWREGGGYQSNRKLCGAWQYVGGGAYALHVDHQTLHFSDSMVIAPGAVLLYLGSTYWHHEYHETGQHVFQVIDPGPGFGPEVPIEPHLRGPIQVGGCYELTEVIDDKTVGRWWPAVFRRVAWSIRPAVTK